MSWKADFDRLIAAMERAEGGQAGLVKGAQHLYPSVTNYPEAYSATRDAVMRALWDFASRDTGRFIEFLGQRWAPQGIQDVWSECVKEFYCAPRGG